MLIKFKNYSSLSKLLKFKIKRKAISYIIKILLSLEGTSLIKEINILSLSFIYKSPS